jgi:hypothetical protein
MIKQVDDDADGKVNLEEFVRLVTSKQLRCDTLTLATDRCFELMLT